MNSRLRKFIHATLLSVALFECTYAAMPHLAYADSSITSTATASGSTTQQICEPSQGADSSRNLTRCIHNIYLFALAFVGSFAVLMFVIAGYMYMTGTEESVKKAKHYISRTLIALILLLIPYIILNTINPELTTLPDLSVGQVSCNTSVPVPGRTINCSALPSDTSNGKTTSNPNAGQVSIAGCNSCSDLSIVGLPVKDSNSKFLNTDLANALLRAYNSVPVFRVTEAYPPTVTHKAPCHSDGTCADLGLNSSDKLNVANIKSVCTALKRQNIVILNEYYEIPASQFVGSDCPPPQRFDTTTAGDLHVHL